MVTFPCPICNYQMDQEPVDWRYCPSCGTQFGYHDAGRSYEALRHEWVRSGMLWWSPFRNPPVDWNPWEQVSVFYRPRIVSDEQSVDSRVRMRPATVVLDLEVEVGVA